MVQERDIKPRKVQEADFDRPLPPRNYENQSSVGTDVASGLALLLSVIAFFLSAFAVFQSMTARRSVEGVQPASQSGGGGSFAEPINRPISRPLLPQIAPYRFERVEPGQFVQPAYDGAGQVELVSVARPDASSDEVTFRVRVRRSSQPLQSPGTINLARTSILNTRTNETFSVTSYSKDAIYLANLRSGGSTDATVSAQIPVGRDRIDLEIPGTRVFRNVPISIGNS